MAIRGVKPKPSGLHLIKGTYRKDRHSPDLQVDPNFDNGLEPPKRLRKRQLQLWTLYVRRAPWLKVLDIPRAHMWVELHTEWERKPEAMVSARIAQLRVLGSELGLDPASRARMGVRSGTRPPKKDPASKYLT